MPWTIIGSYADAVRVSAAFASITLATGSTMAAGITKMLMASRGRSRFGALDRSLLTALDHASKLLKSEPSALGDEHISGNGVENVTDATDDGPSHARDPALDDMTLVPAATSIV